MLTDYSYCDTTYNTDHLAKLGYKLSKKTTITTQMEQSPSWEANSHSDIKKIPSIYPKYVYQIFQKIVTRTMNT